MGIQGMKVHRHFPRGIWPERHPPPPTLRCKRLRPLSPAATHLKSFIRPSKPGAPVPFLSSSDRHHNDSPDHQVELEGTQAGGTRWNPTQEQIGYLEMLYRGGIRTPNAQQIEHITAHLGKFGKIEGKNVFYWFQNHKARERQKQKRTCLKNTTTPPLPLIDSCLVSSTPRNCTEGEGAQIRTLELFPLHPEGRSC